MATKPTRKTSVRTATVRQPSPTAKAAARKTVEAKQARRAALSRLRTGFGRAARVLLPLRQHLGLAIAAVALTAAAQLSLWWRPALGLYVNAAVFATFCGIALWREQYRKLGISLAILPVATMITLSLPQSTNFAEAVVFYDAILLLTLVYRFWFTLDEPLESTALSARGYGLTLPLMAVVGQVLGVVGYLLLRTQYMYQPTSLPLVAAACVVFAITEEMLFRGLIQQRAAKIMRPGLAAVVSAALYALVSIDHSTWRAPLFGLLSGVVLSFIYLKKQNLLLTIAVNATSKLAYVGLLATFILR